MADGASELRWGSMWARAPDAQLIASAALLTALQCRSGSAAALQPLTRTFTRRLAQRHGQQLCCARGGGGAPPASVGGSGRSAAPSPPSPATTTGGGGVQRSAVYARPVPSEASAQGASAGGGVRHVPGVPVSAAPASSTRNATTATGASNSITSITSTSSTSTMSTTSIRTSSTATPPAAASTCNAARTPYLRSGLLPHAHHGQPVGIPPLLRIARGRVSAARPHAAAEPRAPFPSPAAATSTSSFRTFASAAAGAATAAAAGAPLPAAAPAARRLAAAAAAAAARHTRAGVLSSQAYLASVRHNVRQSALAALAAPYQLAAAAGGGGAAMAAAAAALARLPYSWGSAGLRQMYILLLNAAAAKKLPLTLALAVAELCRTSRTAHADAFRFQMEAPESGPEAELPLWQALPLQLAALLSSLARTLWLLLLFAPVILSAPMALQLNWRRPEWMEMLRSTLEAAGPAFIKWGQWAATRHDLFPPDMCSELERLHTQAPAHGFRHTRRAIEEAFGLPVGELFSHIDTQPVASGSIGQIHRATLSDKGAAMAGLPPGTVVAVKVRHPGVGAAILRDFATMMAVAHVAALLPSLAPLRLEQTLSQFAAPLREQVDLAREASNLARFNHNFRKTRHVFFPVPLYPLVTQDVLVETYERGDHITRYIQSENNPYNHRLSELGSGTMLQMMLVDNLIHSDLHPGNILVRLDPPGGLLGLVYSALDAVRGLTSLSAATRARIELLQSRWLQPSLVLLDVGMATELSPVDQTNMVGLFRSFAAMDGRACGDWTLAFSGTEQSCPDPEAFRSDMQAAFDELHKMDEAARGDGERCAFKNGADALASVLELVRLHQVSLPGHICAVVVTTLVLEGWSNKLDPDHSVLSQVQAMFESENVPWSRRMAQLVDRVMEEEANHFALA